MILFCPKCLVEGHNNIYLMKHPAVNFFNLLFSWKKIALQCFVGFYHTI